MHEEFGVEVSFYGIVDVGEDAFAEGIAGDMHLTGEADGVFLEQDDFLKVAGELSVLVVAIFYFDADRFAGLIIKIIITLDEYFAETFIAGRVIGNGFYPGVGDLFDAVDKESAVVGDG